MYRGVGIKYIHIPQLGIGIRTKRQDLKSTKDYEILFLSHMKKSTLKKIGIIFCMSEN